MLITRKDEIAIMASGSIFITVLVCLIILSTAGCDQKPDLQISQAGHDSSFSMKDNLLTLVQQKTFDYFYTGAHPSGLVYDRITSGSSGGTSDLASGGSGMGLMVIIVGVSRNFIPRSAGASRVSNILDYLSGAVRYHGAWPHFIDPATKDGAGTEGNDSYLKGDIVETAYISEGLLTAIQYFNQSNPVEAYIRDKANDLWTNIDWDFYRNGTDFIYWHWSSVSGFECSMQQPVSGFNECMIVYLLAMASPTHPVGISCYTNGWIRSGYTTSLAYNGIPQYLQIPAWGMDLRLFWTHYSYLGFDPRTINDGNIPSDKTYYDVFRNITLINRAYCIDNPNHHTGYSSLVWGLTASDDPNGYTAHSPVPYDSANGYGDSGVIAPTAAISAMPYTPEESYAVLSNFYFNAQNSNALWGEYGFKDAFKPDGSWCGTDYLAIDQGPIVIMIENYRTQLMWKLFMSHPDIQTNLLPKLEAAGWTVKEQDYP